MGNPKVPRWSDKKRANEWKTRRFLAGARESEQMNGKPE
ncbi:hypothetical protein A2U01_0109152, partial [Trifolium medium]|nr:hypothetical protein [Trifolium medium]